MSCKVSFIGLGVMGYPMAGYISKAGHNVTVYNRTRSKSEKWIKQYKGKIAETPEEAARESDFVFTCVGNDDDLREVAVGKKGIFNSIKKGSIQDTIFEFTKRRPDNIEFQKGEDEEFLVLHIEKGTEPTYVNEKNKELYYIRLDGESVPCYGGDMVRHMKKRFPTDIGSNKNDTGGRWNQNRRHYRR